MKEQAARRYGTQYHTSDGVVETGLVDTGLGRAWRWLGYAAIAGTNCRIPVLGYLPAGVWLGGVFRSRLAGIDPG